MGDRYIKAFGVLIKIMKAIVWFKPRVYLMCKLIRKLQSLERREMGVHKVTGKFPEKDKNGCIQE